MEDLEKNKYLEQVSQVLHKIKKSQKIKNKMNIEEDIKKLKRKPTEQDRIHFEKNLQAISSLLKKELLKRKRKKRAFSQ